MFFGEAFYESAFVLPDALGELAGDADVERAVAGVSEEVDLELFFQNALLTIRRSCEGRNPASSACFRVNLNRPKVARPLPSQGDAK